MAIVDCCKAKGTITEVLRKVAECDADFSGDNGPEYLWPDAKQAGYQTNRDYALVAAKSNDAHEYCKNFLKMWMGNDNYYADYTFDLSLIQKAKQGGENTYLLFVAWAIA